MRLKFTSTEYLREYHGRNIDAMDGDIVEVSDFAAEVLLADFPDNFALVEEQKAYHASENKILTPTNTKAKRR